MTFLKFFVLLFVTIFVSADDGPYFPCKSFISFSYDDSNFMRNEDFKTQINFIKNAIGTLNYPERLRAEGGYTAEFSWNSGLSIEQMEASFAFSQQTLMSYSLLQEFASLVTSLETMDSTNDPIGALIFISDTSDRALFNADRLMSQLNGVKITFVLLGPDADQSKLTKFSSNFITWRNLTQSQPDNWDTVAAAAYGCIGGMSTVTVPSLTTPTMSSTVTTSQATSTMMTSPSVTGSTSQQYIPCQSWISFSYDDSNVLQNANFRTQMSFISSVIGSLNFPNRIRIQGAYTDVASWNSGQSLTQMQTELENSEQTNNPYSLLLEFANLVNYLPTNQWPVGAIVFISDTSDNALKNAIRFVPQLSNVRLTFVLLGPNVDETKLTNFTSNFIYWKDLSKPQPDNWDTVATSAFGCISPSSVSTPLLSSSTIQGVTTGSTPLPPTGTTLVPYIPCQSWIHFGVDDSNVLPSNNFKMQLNFISSAIGNINHPERIAAYGAFSEEVPWNSGFSIELIQQAVTQMFQAGAYNLRQQFNALLTDLQDIPVNNKIPIGALIFISDTSDQALANADQPFNQIPTSVRITFVLLGPNPDQSKLTKYSSNFITWRDFSQLQPDNWNSQYGPAYGCMGGGSTLVPASSTVTPPSPSNIPTVGTTPTVPYIPCQSWISFGIDDSNVLSNNNFMTQLTFISSAVGNITHPERIQALGGYSIPAAWNSGFSIPQIQYNINKMHQGGSYNLIDQFSALLTNLQSTQINNIPVGALIFISDTSDSALIGADQIFPLLTDIMITFVLLGPNADSSKLTKFSNNFIYWKDLSKPQPDNWDTVAASAFGCTTTTASTVTPITISSPSSVSVTRGGITIHTVQTVTSTSLPPSSTIQAVTTTQMTPTGTTTTLYIPCQTWISFSYDDSRTLQTTDFETQMLFISSVIGGLNYPDRLRINGAFTGVASWNSHQSVSQMQNEISNAEPTTNSYSLLMELAALLTDVENIGTTNWPIGALVFISDTSDAAIRRAGQYVSQLSNVRLTFVLLGPNVDETKLTNLTSNFIYWKDLSKPQPDNWDTVAASAFGCSNPTSVSLPASTSTPIPPSSTIQVATTTISSPSMAPTGAGTTLVPYVPCQSWISFSFDDSSSLQNNDFKTQMNFISSAIGTINYPNRLRVNGAFTGVASWNSQQTISQMQNEIANSEQTSNSYSLLLQFAGLLTDVEGIGTTNLQIGALIFISDTSDAAIRNAVIYFAQLPSNVRVTFVLLGPNADQTKLVQFSSNFITWKDLSQPAPDNWDVSYFNAYGCQ